MLAIERLGKVYPNGVNALERFSADIRLGEIVAIIGGSGCGKSTLLRAIAGLDRATTGTVTLDNIKRTVAGYYNIRLSDLSSPRRTRSLARPRQVAMALAKELTQHSYPEIGSAFDKDHTTVMHACRKIAELRDIDDRLREDFENLQRVLTN